MEPGGSELVTSCLLCPRCTLREKLVDTSRRWKARTTASKGRSAASRMIFVRSFSIAAVENRDAAPEGAASASATS